MRKYVSMRKATKYLKENAVFEDKSLKVNKRFVKRLRDECRLLPVKSGLFGARYSMQQLEKYVEEVHPR